jgi:sodium transport system permease protein
MQLKNVKLIYFREMRDQLRDRRTLFLIAVLPLLLYPLLGMSFFQLSQFLQKHDSTVLVLGAEQLKEIDWLPPLIDGDRFDGALFDDITQQQGIKIVHPDAFHEAKLTGDAAEVAAAAGRLLDADRVEAVLIFPADFDERLREVRDAMVGRSELENAEPPQPEILYNAANEKSQLTQLRTYQAVRRWRDAVTQKNLVDSHVPMGATTPFEVKLMDVAPEQQRRAVFWSKVLPLIVFVWALTGAFYPAVDLCAGEKERGTLETLLTSPALRREIVWGKLLTIMTFSSVTALLNLSSLGVTGKFVIDQLSQADVFGGQNPLSMPSVTAIAWLALALVPISALFSALCLACAAFARSTKEGQYYLMPLMMVSMPLMLLPMSPGVEFNLGNSLVPLTGMVLLLRSVIEGQFEFTPAYLIQVGAVMTVTLTCCLLAIRWAEEQFNRESVLFRESERLDMRRMLVHMVRDRGDTPSFGQAALCVALILIVQFFLSIAMSANAPGELTFTYLAKTLLASQLGCVLAPTLIMAIILTRRPARTLLLDRAPRVAHLVAAAALAILLHPVASQLNSLIQRLYPPSQEVIESAGGIERALSQAPSWWAVVAIMALLPALCEELAFRGFVMSGFRHVGHKWWAIVLSAVAFGGVHMFLSQKISAAALGIVIGYLAIHTGSLWPGVLFHAIHNGILVSLQRWATAIEANPKSPLGALMAGDEPLLYHPASVAACVLVAGAILWSLSGTTFQNTREEQIEEARQRQDTPLVSA